VLADLRLGATPHIAVEGHAAGAAGERGEGQRREAVVAVALAVLTVDRRRIRRVSGPGWDITSLSKGSHLRLNRPISVYHFPR